jgi:hypothetical protein
MVTWLISMVHTYDCIQLNYAIVGPIHEMGEVPVDNRIS